MKREEERIFKSMIFQYIMYGFLADSITHRNWKKKKIKLISGPEATSKGRK